jgi:ATP-dependent Clp protease adaptor protein ClpS
MKQKEKFKWDHFNMDHYIKVLNAKNQTDVEEETDIDELIKEANKRSLILYDDNVNDFHHVINCLIIFLKKDPNAAEQCALIAHNRGKCSVKSGSFDELEPLHRSLSENQLTVEIQ